MKTMSLLAAVLFMLVVLAGLGQALDSLLSNEVAQTVSWNFDQHCATECSKACECSSERLGVLCKDNCPECLGRGSPCGTKEFLHEDSPSLLQVEAEHTEKETRTLSEKVYSELHELLDTVKSQAKAIKNLEAQQSKLLKQSSIKKHKSKAKSDDSILKEGAGFPDMDNLMRFQQHRSKSSRKALLQRIVDDAVEFVQDD